VNRQKTERASMKVLTQVASVSLLVALSGGPAFAKERILVLTDIEGPVSSPEGPGRKEHILEVIDCYAKDYANLKTDSDHCPTLDAVRALSKQGAVDRPGFAGVGQNAEGVWRGRVRISGS